MITSQQYSRQFQFIHYDLYIAFNGIMNNTNKNKSRMSSCVMNSYHSILTNMEWGFRTVNILLYCRFSSESIIKKYCIDNYTGILSTEFQKLSQNIMLMERMPLPWRGICVRLHCRMTSHQLTPIHFLITRKMTKKTSDGEYYIKSILLSYHNDS